MRNSIPMNFILFSCFLLIGYSISTRIYPTHFGEPTHLENVTYGQSGGSIDSMNNGQRSILFIGVDSLDSSKPKLVSLWLVSYLPSDPTVYLFPIYPSGNELLTDQENTYRQSFSISRVFDLKTKTFTPVINEKLFDGLKENNYWWSGYIILDQSALTKLNDILAGNGKGLDNGSQKQASPDSPLVSLDSKSAFSSQMSFFQNFCQNINRVKEIDFSQLEELSPIHLSTDMDLHQMLSEWESALLKLHSLNCKYPTMQTSSSE